MKKTLNPIFLIVSIITIFTACNKSHLSPDDGDVNVLKSFSSDFDEMSRVEIYENIGEWHNDYQDFILTKLTNSNLTLSSEDVFYDSLYLWSVDFYSDKNIIFNQNEFEMHFINGMEEDEEITYIEDFSSTANDIVLSLVNEMDKFDESSLLDYILSIENEVYSLSVESEFVVVASFVSTLKSSLLYWNEEVDYWTDKIMENNYPFDIYSSNNNNERKVDVDLKKLVGADARGAIRGAFGGGGLGPGGAMAGGVLGGAAYSTGNLLYQIGKDLISKKK